MSELSLKINATLHVPRCTKDGTHFDCSGNREMMSPQVTNVAVNNTKSQLPMRKVSSLQQTKKNS